MLHTKCHEALLHLKKTHTIYGRGGYLGNVIKILLINTVCVAYGGFISNKLVCHGVLEKMFESNGNNFLI